MKQRLWAVSFAIVALALVACGGETSTVDEAVRTTRPIAPVTATTVPPLALGILASLPSSPGLSMAVLSLTAGRCDGGAALLVEAEISNDTDLYNRSVPSIVVRSPDNQRNVNFTGFSDYPNFYNLPQGLPPRSKTKAFYCVATDNRLNRGQFVGALPTSFSGWIVDSQLGPRWQVR